jgi:CspA family cold shock protein
VADREATGVRAGIEAEGATLADAAVTAVAGVADPGVAGTTATGGTAIMTGRIPGNEAARRRTTTATADAGVVGAAEAPPRRRAPRVRRFPRVPRTRAVHGGWPGSGHCPAFPSGMRAESAGDSTSMHTGTIKWFDNKKGFGFITVENMSDIFVHYSNIEGDGFKTLKDGEPVTCDVLEGEKGLYAENVRRVDS